jgi:glycine/sarcosine N-methyltransferase
MNNREFYDLLARDYDSMINSDKIIHKRKGEFKKVLNPEIKTAADIGSGTGNDSIALALNGLDVTGFEPSEEMIRFAREKTKIYEVQASFINCLSEKIPQSFYGKFDIAVSLGNSIANIHRNVIGISFRKIFSLLRSDSRFILQILNYDNLRKEESRIVNITGDDKYIFVRFYDFAKNNLLFNVLIIDKKDYGKYELITTELEEYKTSELADLLRKAGFKKTELYGGIDFSRYDKSGSKNIVLVAYK